jgi:hypothetical protein
MSFWQLSDGADLKSEKDIGKFEISGGNLEPIPDDTTCVAVIDEAKWDRDQGGNEFISLRWSVVSPPEFKNRKIFQKLWVSDLDPNAKDKGVKKRDNAKKMLGSIDAHTGGKLLAVDEPPTDERLSTNLTLKPLVIKVKLWDIDGKKGNWIAAVTSKDKAPVQVKAVSSDEIPF